MRKFTPSYQRLYKKCKTVRTEGHSRESNLVTVKSESSTQCQILFRQERAKIQRLI